MLACFPMLTKHAPPHSGTHFLTNDLAQPPDCLRTHHPPPTLNRTPELYGLQPTSCRPCRPSLFSRAGFFQPEPRSAPSTAISGNRCLTRLLLPIIYLFLLLFPLRPSCQRRAAVRKQRKAEAAGRAGSGAKRRERGTPRHPCLLTLEDHEHWAGGQER